MPRSPHSIRFAPGDPPDPTVTVRPMTDDEIRRHGPPGRSGPGRPDPATAEPPPHGGVESAPGSPPAPVHPEPHDAPVRARLAAGESVQAVAQALDVPVHRVRSWQSGLRRTAAARDAAPHRRRAPAAEAALRHWVAWARTRWSRHPRGGAVDRPVLQAVCAHYGAHVRDPRLADAAFWLTWFLDRWTSERVASDWETVQAEISPCLQCLDYCLGAAGQPG